MALPMIMIRLVLLVVLVTADPQAYYSRYSHHQPDKCAPEVKYVTKTVSVPRYQTTTKVKVQTVSVPEYRTETRLQTEYVTNYETKYETEYEVDTVYETEYITNTEVVSKYITEKVPQYITKTEIKSKYITVSPKPTTDPYSASYRPRPSSRHSYGGYHG